MKHMVASARTWFTVLTLLEITSIGRAAHKPDAERQFGRAVLSAQRGDYWQALRDAEAVLRVEPGWAEARQLRRTAGFEAHYREALRLIAAGEWKEAQGQLENARTYSTNAGLAARLRQVRSHLRQEDTVHTQEDRFESARVEAGKALERADFDTARARLRECLQYRPHDSDVRQELDKLDSRAARIAAATAYLASVTQALAAGDWRLLEQRMIPVPEIVETAPDVPGRDLLPALQLYARGRQGEARDAAKLLVERQGTDAAAQSFLLFLNSHARRREGSAILAVLGGTYVGVLLLSLYAGLRREAMKVGTASRGATS